MNCKKIENSSRLRHASMSRRKLDCENVQFSPIHSEKRLLRIRRCLLMAELWVWNSGLQKGYNMLLYVVMKTMLNSKK